MEEDVETLTQRMYAQLEKIKERMYKLEVHREVEEKRVDKLEQTVPVLMDKMDAVTSRVENVERTIQQDVPELKNKLDAISKQMNRTAWIVVGISGTLSVIWAIGSNAMKIVEIFTGS